MFSNAQTALHQVITVELGSYQWNTTVDHDKAKFDALVTHFNSHPASLWDDRYHVFQSAGRSGKLKFVLYDQAAWGFFIEQHIQVITSARQESRNTLSPSLSRQRMNKADTALVKSLRLAWVGSDEISHTISRLSGAIECAEKIVRGLQGDLESLFNELTHFNPDVLIAYGGVLELLEHYCPESCPSVIITITESACPQAVSRLKNRSPKVVIRSILSATEFFVIAVSCENNRFHWWPTHQCLWKDSQGFLSIMTQDNSLVTNHPLPFKAHPVECECEVKECAFELIQGRTPQIVWLNSRDGRLLPFHRIVFRTWLDRLPGFPGAHIENNTPYLTVHLKGEYNRHTVIELLSSKLSTHKVDLNKIKIEIHEY